MKVTPANEQERQQVEDLAAEVQAVTGENVVGRYGETVPPDEQLAASGTDRVFVSGAGHVADIDIVESLFCPDFPGLLQGL